MTTEQIDVLVIGAGQAGVAMSRHLTALTIPHLVLERGRIAERWRSERWDALVANGPAWHDRFPDMDFASHPDGFPGKEEVADYFVAYARQHDAPIRCGVTVTGLTRRLGQPGYLVATDRGQIAATQVVVATGPFQRPLVPPIVPESAGVVQMHSTGYRNPAALPPGGVLVVGAGSSGAQIADELNRAGRQVWLSVGPHDRPPRRYRGRDFVWWLGVLGKWDMQATPGVEHTTIAVSGAHGGETMDFRRLAHRGVTLVGRTESFADGTLRFAPDAAANVASGDRYLMTLLDEADAHVARTGLDLPPEPEARILPPDPPCLTDPVTDLDLTEQGVGTIIWATGFAPDFGWIDLPVLDDRGHPRHQRGVSTEPGLYFLGLPWLSRRGSSFIWGVWHDAKYLADQIAIQRSYAAYRPAPRPAAP